MPFEGIVSVLKPPGMTSSDVVVDIRKIFREKRVGHTGTLDPAAAGVLPICIGRATRLFDYLVDKEKEYLAEIRFGTATDTGDAFGKITESADCSVSADELSAVLPAFIGEQDQIPPIYSSLSVNGVKLYKLARQGQVTQPLEDRKRRISIYSLGLEKQLGKNSFLLRVRCSKGTYIRTLVGDVGQQLGLPAYMPFLLRTRSGKFGLEDSFTIAELRALAEEGGLEKTIVPMDKAADHIPALRLTDLTARQRRLLINGAPIPFEGIPAGQAHRLYIDEEFMGLAELSGEGLHVTVWLGNEDLQHGGKTSTEE
ncbi:MAG: tRNA pseudouridine(55) synthase TruB [Clostridia bacterium]|nr:tRNA pseudouridine(55) synthase TruB [Clostridia bacterium]